MVASYPHPPLKDLTESEFNVLRIAIDFAYIDGYLDESERKVIEKLIDDPRLTVPQQRILQLDMERGQVDYLSLLEKIDHEKDLGTLILIAGVIIKRDGIIHPKEQEAFDKLLSIHYSDMDIANARLLADEQATAYAHENFDKPAEFSWLDRIFDMIVRLRY
jgi:tellurite resistance protein